MQQFCDDSLHAALSPCFVQVEQFLEGLREAAEKVLVAAGYMQPPGATQQQQQSSKPAPAPALPKSIMENHEPYFHGEWRKTPYEPRSYETLTDYAIRTNVAEEVSSWSGAEQCHRNI